MGIDENPTSEKQLKALELGISSKART